VPFDPLAALCDRAHAAGIAVHAWLGATPVAQGGAVEDRFLPWLSRRVDGADRDRHGIAHLDPGHPGARRFVAGCAAAIASRYPVDGVSLDRVRYPESASRGRAEWGGNAEALARFAADSGEGRPGDEAWPDPSDPAWQAWRRAQVTALVAETVAAVRAVRDDVTVSATGTCFGGLEAGWTSSRPWVECGQDWRGWLADGLLDAVLVMDYRGDADDADLVGDPPPGVDLSAEGAVAQAAPPARLRERFEAWARLAMEAGGSRAVLGTGLYLRDPIAAAAEVRHALSLTADGRRAGGWCGYSYRTPSRSVLDGRRDAAAARADLAVALRDVGAVGLQR
jgi:hypothetical protein